MGIVYEAEQVSLGRRVALKVLPRHALLHPQSLDRFHREARSAARLHHTNIVQVFGTGEQDGLHYFVMQLIRGVGLDQVVADLARRTRGRPPERRRPGPSHLRLDPRPSSGETLSRRLPEGLASGSDTCPTEMYDSAQPLPRPGERPEDRKEARSTKPSDSDTAAAPLDPFSSAYWAAVAGLGIQAAEALAFAHAEGIVHRDVKPSNLLLDEQGRLSIADFGLAKESDGGAALTNTGFLVGTLRYLPPECFAGKSRRG
jgi:eukaryotic-like serine/threonine-protein kinase